MGRWTRLPRSRAVWALTGLILVLIAVRVALPHVVKRYVNRTLDQLDGYTGHVEDVDISLWRGAYQIEGVRIDKTGGGTRVPFFRAHTIDLSVAWDALLRGSIVAEIDLHSPEINFVVAPEPAQEQTEPASNWTETVKDLVPFQIDRFAVYDGEVHYRDFDGEPNVDIYLQSLRGSVRNMTNSEELGESLFARFDVRALAMGSGKLHIEGTVNPYAEQPTFALEAQLADLDITQLNDFLKSHANIDAEKGKFSVDTELAASSGEFRGYIKPFIRDLQVLDWSEEEEGFLTKVWEGAVEVAGEVLEDQPRDTIATRVPLQGEIEDPQPGIWSTIGGLLRNAFIESLRRGIEGSVGLKRGLENGEKRTN